MLAILLVLEQKNIVHRDIKLENILLVDDSENLGIKLVDFGLATYKGVRNVSHRCGTPGYAAPEILSRKSYNLDKVDIYSLGVVLYIL